VKYTISPVLTILPAEAENAWGEGWVRIWVEGLGSKVGGGRSVDRGARLGVQGLGCMIKG